MQTGTVLIQSRLSFFDHSRKGGFFVLCGDPRVHSVACELLLRPLSQGCIITVLDAGNAFDPYLISRIAQALKREPREFLSRIFISRSFTCHQTHALVQKVFAGLNANRSSLILMLGLLTTFYDEEVPLGERRALFKKTLGLFKGISRKGVKVLITSTDPPVRVNGGFAALVIQAADGVARLDAGPEGGLILNVVKEIPEVGAVPK